MSWAKHASVEILKTAEDSSARRFWRNVLLATGGLAAVGGAAYLANQHSGEIKDWLNTLGKSDKDKAMELKKNELGRQQEAVESEASKLKAEADKSKDLAASQRAVEHARKGELGQFGDKVQDVVLADGDLANAARPIGGAYAGVKVGDKLLKNWAADSAAGDLKTQLTTANKPLLDKLDAATAAGDDVKAVNWSNAARANAERLSKLPETSKVIGSSMGARRYVGSVGGGAFGAGTGLLGNWLAARRNIPDPDFK